MFLVAVKVGGIIANQNVLADFMYDNMILLVHRLFIFVWLTTHVGELIACKWT
ncbi:hypothetical protein [Bacteroides intestinalis]|uniref:hypothetical protein n=1 Tax=uncultured Bacteroides sp. TaxID=162156 RepID=UPI001CE28DD3|nr:hypothetical protein [Bacteroides intestinalis]